RWRDSKGLWSCWQGACPSSRGADNPSSRYHPPRFYLWTRMRVVPYKTEKDMLPEPLFSTSQKSPLNETIAFSHNTFGRHCGGWDVDCGCPLVHLRPPYAGLWRLGSHDPRPSAPLSWANRQVAEVAVGTDTDPESHGPV